MRKEIEGKSVNKSSIVDMAGAEAAPNVRKSLVSEQKMKEILNYKDGPVFRERKIAEKISQTDSRYKTPAAVRRHEIQTAEYMLNRINSKASKIVFS